jgi:O-antigen ligase
MKINYKGYLKKIGYLLVLIHPLDAYTMNFPIVNISLYRLLFALLFATFIIFKILKEKTIINSKINFLLFLLGVSTIFSLFWNGVLDNRAYSYFLNSMMGLILIFIFINIYESESDLYYLIKNYFFSFLFNIYTYVYLYYNYLINGKSLSNIRMPFMNIFPFRIIGLYLDPGRSNSFFGVVPRVGLLYKNPTHLSLAIALAIILSFYILKRNNKTYLKFLVFLINFILTIILFNTFSRSGIFALIISVIIIIIIRFFINYKGKIIVKKNKIILFLVILFLLLPVLYKTIPMVLNSRLFNASNSTSRHLEMRIEALKIWLSNTLNFLLGIGLFNSPIYAETTSAHFHSSYINILVERGIIGFIFSFSIYIYIFFKLLYKALKNNGNYIIFNSFICILISFLFYEFFYSFPVWIVLAIISVYLTINERKEFEK